MTAVGQDSRLRYAEALTEFVRDHARNDPATNIVDPMTGIPYEWAFRHVHVDRALNLTRGSPDILIGIVDSGWSDIRDLSGKVAGGWYYTTQASNVWDFDGHGTFVASIIAAPNDDGFGLAGFCGACRLDVFKDLALTQFSTAAAIRRLVDDHVRIINLSLGGYGFSFILADALDYAISHGVLVVASSGNDGIGIVKYPAAYLQPPNGVLGYGLAVGASDIDDRRAGFSNWGSRLSLLAPGAFRTSCSSGIWAALPTIALDFDFGDGCNSNYIDTETGARYAYASGTSFAAPEVAGVAALVWAVRPELKNYEVASILEQTATRPPGIGWQADRGWGVLNAAAALERATGRSSSDSVSITYASAAVMPRPGRRFALNIGLEWQDGVPVNAGSLTCTARAAGRQLAAVTRTFGSRGASCSWRIPKWAARKRMAVDIDAADTDGNPAHRTFAFSVRRR
jgi:subtilisin family serine protease